MIINKNKEVTQTKNCRRKNSNKETADDDQVLDEDERNMLKTTQGVIIQNVRICDGHCGIMIWRMGSIWIEKSVFFNLSYDVCCLQSSRCVLFQNRFYNCAMTGIFLKDHSVRFIAGNGIYENTEALSKSAAFPQTYGKDWTNEDFHYGFFSVSVFKSEWKAVDLVTFIEKIPSGKTAMKYLVCGFWERAKREFAKFLLQQSPLLSMKS